MVKNTIRRIAVLLAAVGLTACGGGGGSGSTSAGGSTGTGGSASLSGTAATGAPIAGATVTLVDSAGKQVSGTTDSTGKYSLSPSGLTPPFLVKVVTSSASTQGYPAGTTFYSVSAEANPSVINVTPLTDLILRTWYAAQSTPVSVTQAFSNPTSNPPPSVTDVRVIETVVMSIVQPVLQANGVSSTGLDLIASPFAANGSGVDAALDAIKPITYNSSGSNATLTIATNSTTTQNTTLGVSSGGTTTTTNVVNTSTGATSSSVTSAVVPTGTAEANALAGVQTTLTNLMNTINAKGTALAAADVATYIDTAFLNNGRNPASQAADIAKSMAGTTITAFNITSVTSFDATNNLIGIIGTVTYTLNGSTYSQTLGGGDTGDGEGMIFKQESNGSWLFYGDQQQVRTAARIISATSNGPSNSVSQGQYLWIQASVPASSSTSPCSSTYASSMSVTPATPIMGTNTNGGAPMTVGSGFALALDPTVFQSNVSTGWECQFDTLVGSMMSVASTNLAAVVGDTIGFSFNGGSAIPALAKTVPGYTTEYVNFANMSSNALSAAKLGTPLTVQWKLPVTFAVAYVEVYGEVSVPSGSGNATCMAKTAAPLGVTATTATITLPTSCNGTGVASLPQPGPSAASVSLLIRGTHGEEADAWWGFN